VAKLELFHLLADPASARVRKEVEARRLLDRCSFRNVHFESHRAALDAVGGGEVPAIHDGARLHVGVEACLAWLRSLSG
jgi:hypothetical protein